MTTLRRLTQALLICMLLIATDVSSSPDNHVVTVILDWFANPNHAPLFVALQQGYFAQQGLTVKLVNPADPTDPVKLVAAKQADIAVTYQPNLLLSVAQGLPLVRIATLINSPLNCLIVLKEGPIRQLKDLRDKRIGYASASVDIAMLTQILKTVGLTIHDVQLTNVHFNLSQALLSKRVDAIIGAMRNFELTQIALAGIPGRAFYPEAYGVPSYDELVFVVHQDTVNDPRLPKFVKALQQGTEYLIHHPVETWQIFAKQHPELNNALNHQAWVDTVSRFSTQPGVLDSDRYEKFAVFLQATHLIDHMPALDSYAVDLIDH